MTRAIMDNGMEFDWDESGWDVVDNSERGGGGYVDFKTYLNPNKDTEGNREVQVQVTFGQYPSELPYMTISEVELVGGTDKYHRSMVVSLTDFDARHLILKAPSPNPRTSTRRRER